MTTVGDKDFADYVARVSVEAQDELTGIPQRLANFDTILASVFAFKSPSEAEKIFAAKVNDQALANELLQRAMTSVKDEVYSAIVSMQKIERWIQLCIPRIEDGNNFGVEVQRAVLQQVSGSKLSLQTGFDSLPDYAWQRGLAFEKFAKKLNKERSKTKGSTISKGGKDGEEVKTNTGDSEKETESQTQPIPDFIAHIIAIDVKWYFNLKRILECVRDHYSFSYDAVKKNNAKLLLPRGHGSTMHMW